jgi:leucyl aminopeptidase
MKTLIKVISEPETFRSECLVVPVFHKGKLSKAAQKLNASNDGIIQKLVNRDANCSALAETLLIPSANGIKAERILLLGCGDKATVSESEFRKLISKTLKSLNDHKIKNACLMIEELSVSDKDQAWMAKQVTIDAGNSSYHYSKTLSKPKPAKSLSQLTLSLKADKANKEAIRQGQAIALGMNTAKELGNLPANICTPTYLANQAKSLARKKEKLSVSIVEEKKMRELGMGSLLSVSAGSTQPAKLIVMEYKGAAKSKRPHMMVGKGITFDTGGISLKPGSKMDEMKYDMCGAAGVFGAMAAVVELQLPINVVAIIAAAENMPSGIATKPGDVVTSMSGQTIEVLNTDAEGRLVLCDALTYGEKFKPQSVIDVATLTGACVVALGRHATGLFSNQDDFAEELLTAGQQIGDRAWHMPLWDDYQPQLDSNFADIANIGGPEAGSVTAACFLSRFAKSMRWAHLDIAGTAWISGANKGATGRPVSLLTQYLINKSGK